jgi:hypothetical protein
MFRAIVKKIQPRNIFRSVNVRYMPQRFSCTVDMPDTRNEQINELHRQIKQQEILFCRLGHLVIKKKKGLPFTAKDVESENELLDKYKQHRLEDAKAEKEETEQKLERARRDIRQIVTSSVELDEEVDKLLESEDYLKKRLQRLNLLTPEQILDREI